jgi:hypothetical protein
MFQPRVKLVFIQRYCHPRDGWRVFTDIDGSEEGRTGGERKKPKSVARQLEMGRDAKKVRRHLSEIGVHVGKKGKNWKRVFGRTLPCIEGDRDIIAVHLERKLLLVAEVEGVSSGQPEQKIYKAIGQIVLATAGCTLPGYTRSLIVAVHGEKMKAHLRLASALKRIGVAGVHVAAEEEDDEWLFGPPDCWLTQRWKPCHVQVL